MIKKIKINLTFSAKILNGGFLVCANTFFLHFLRNRFLNSVISFSKIAFTTKEASYLSKANGSRGRPVFCPVTS